MKLLGAILCGGRSSRFGSDKALALLDGQTLFQHVRNGLGRQVDGLIACGPSLFGILSVSDRPEPNLGPLGGINAALHAAKNWGYDAVISVPCDTPILPTDLYEKLSNTAGAYFADIPVIGFWPARLAEQLDYFLQQDVKQSVREWACSIGAVGIHISDTVVNVNTPADIDVARSSLTSAAL